VLSLYQLIQKKSLSGMYRNGSASVKSEALCE